MEVPIKPRKLPTAEQTKNRKRLVKAILACLRRRRELLSARELAGYIFPEKDELKSAKENTSRTSWALMYLFAKGIVNRYPLKHCGQYYFFGLDEWFEKGELKEKYREKLKVKHRSAQMGVVAILELLKNHDTFFTAREIADHLVSNNPAILKDHEKHSSTLEVICQNVYAMRRRGMLIRIKLQTNWNVYGLSNWFDGTVPRKKYEIKLGDLRQLDRLNLSGHILRVLERNNKVMKAADIAQQLIESPDSSRLLSNASNAVNTVNAKLSFMYRGKRVDRIKVTGKGYCYGLPVWFFKGRLRQQHIGQVTGMKLQPMSKRKEKILEVLRKSGHSMTGGEIMNIVHNLEPGKKNAKKRVEYSRSFFRVLTYMWRDGTLLRSGSKGQYSYKLPD